MESSMRRLLVLATGNLEESIGVEEDTPTESH